MRTGSRDVLPPGREGPTPGEGQPAPAAARDRHVGELAALPVLVLVPLGVVVPGVVEVRVLVVPVLEVVVLVGVGVVPPGTPPVRAQPAATPRHPLDLGRHAVDPPDAV